MSTHELVQSYQRSEYFSNQQVCLLFLLFFVSLLSRARFAQAMIKTAASAKGVQLQSEYVKQQYGQQYARSFGGQTGRNLRRQGA